MAGKSNCFYVLLDKMFLGHFIRPLFKPDGDASQVREGLNNTVTTAGVVAALVLSMVVEPAMSSTSETNWAIAASFCWYSSCMMSCFSVINSTLGAVVIAITPHGKLLDSVNEKGQRKAGMGRKLLYAWTLPFEFTFGSVGMLFCGIWIDAESKRELFLLTEYNMTFGLQSFLEPRHGGIVIWFVRFSMVLGLLASLVTSIMMICFSDKIESFTGVEATTIKEHVEEVGKEGKQSEKTTKISPVIED